MTDMNCIQAEVDIVKVQKVGNTFELEGERARTLRPHPLHSFVEEEYSDSMILFGPNGEKNVPILQLGRVHLNIEQSDGNW